MVALPYNGTGIETKFSRGPIVVNASRKGMSSGVFGMKGIIHTLGAGNVIQEKPSIVNIFGFDLPNPCYQIKWDTDLRLQNPDFLTLIRSFYKDAEKRYGNSCQTYVEGLPGIESRDFCFFIFHQEEVK